MLSSGSDQHYFDFFFAKTLHFILSSANQDYSAGNTGFVWHSKPPEISMDSGTPN
jgi:hypothetical protein